MVMPGPVPPLEIRRVLVYLSARVDWRIAVQNSTVTGVCPVKPQKVVAHRHGVP
jgi:hypothetical protein